MNQISEWVLAIMAKFGYLGIIFAMFAENVFPPIPSEIIMPAAGFAVAQGDLNLFYYFYHCWSRYLDHPTDISWVPFRPKL